MSVPNSSHICQCSKCAISTSGVAYESPKATAPPQEPVVQHQQQPDQASMGFMDMFKNMFALIQKGVIMSEEEKKKKESDDRKMHAKCIIRKFHNCVLTFNPPGSNSNYTMRILVIPDNDGDDICVVKMTSESIHSDGGKHTIDCTGVKINYNYADKNSETVSVNFSASEMFSSGVAATITLGQSIAAVKAGGFQSVANVTYPVGTY